MFPEAGPSEVSGYPPGCPAEPSPASGVFVDSRRESTNRTGIPIPPVFWEKRLQAIENKGNEGSKEHKETTKRLQADANKRVGTFEGLKACRWECFRGHPRGDRKSAEAIENRRDGGAPSRKRVRNCMKLLELQGCDRKQRS